MPLIIKKKPVDYAALESGTYVAICLGIAMVGTQMVEDYKSKLPKYKRQVVLLFEVCDYKKKHKNGEPYKITINGSEIDEPQTVRLIVTESLDRKANLSKHIKSWMRLKDSEFEEFDLEKCVGTGCLLSVEKIVSASSGNEYNNIQTISDLIAGMRAPIAILPTFAYTVDEHDEEQFQRMPQWLQETVQKSSEWEAAHANSETVDVSGGKIAAAPKAGGPAF